MEVTLLGTGDTTGTPTPRCDCDTCERAREEDIERTRFSVHVHNERTDETLLIDCSPDFRRQFRRSDVPLPDVAVITHVHFDHLDGLGNAYRLLDRLDVVAPDAAPESVADTIRERYAYLAPLRVHGVRPFVPARICGFDVTLVPVDHPPLPCYGVVVRDPATGAQLSLTGDTTFAVPPASRDRLAGADLLLAEAIVHSDFCEHHPKGGAHHDDEGTPRTFGTKHMTRAGALDLAADLDAERTRLVHASHFYPADEAFADPLAVDGERYVL
jgi:phosphoribosyl 1,2-cyclic phosphate phosphodiesterase